MSFNSSAPDVSRCQDDSGSVSKLLLGVGTLVCAVIICAAARGDLWLDEIWSIFFAEAAKSPWDIISLFKHDNNHLLNTFYLYLIGKQNHLVVYRFFSITVGIGSLFLLTVLAGKWGHLESIFVLLFAGFSYPLILFFSEARGYAPAIFFALSSLFVLEKCLTNYSTIKLLLFWLSSCLGTLSHLSFVIVFLSLSVWVLYKEFSGPSSLKAKLYNSFKYLFIPSAFILVFYLFYARGMTIGGGDINDTSTEISKGIIYLLGLPHSLTRLEFTVLGLFAIVTLIGTYLFCQDKNKLWSFVIGVLVLPPIVIIFTTRPTVYYFRYLVVTYPFFYLMLSHIFGKLYRKSNRYSYVAIILICLYLIGQMQQLWPLFKYGRGNYQAILREVSNNSSGNVLRIGSDHDFRNKMLLSFYQRFMPPYQSLHYIDQKLWNIDSPEWIILHKADRSFKPEPFISISDQQTYKLTKVERSVGESGFSWFLYHTTKPKRSPG
jgi:hypothetical protein